MTARSGLGSAFAVFRKEIVDALRDRRTLLVVLISSVFVGPLALLAMSFFAAGVDERAERRVVFAANIDAAPTLRNFIERQTYTVKAAPADYEAQLRDGTFTEPVIVVPRDFEAALIRGDAPVVAVVADSTNKGAEEGVGQVHALLEGFNTERGLVVLAVRGVSAYSLEAIQVKEQDLASAQSRATQLTGVLPFFVIVAVLYGALSAALDTTAGERERGSLEPLLMNPTGPIWLVLGKWGAVAFVSMLIAVLACVSFLPGQWLLVSDSLQALFRFGLREALLFMVLLVPFAAAFSAVLMAVAIGSKSYKEAQANSSLAILLATMLPLLPMLSAGEPAWQLWVPGLAQSVLMTRVLKGEELAAIQVLVPLIASIVLTAVCIWSIARRLREAAVR